jgi:hypothetical protein
VRDVTNTNLGFVPLACKRSDDAATNFSIGNMTSRGTERLCVSRYATIILRMVTEGVDVAISGGFKAIITALSFHQEVMSLNS